MVAFGTLHHLERAMGEHVDHAPMVDLAEEVMDQRFASCQATILYSLDSTLNLLRILNGWAHLDRKHIIGKRLMRAFERW